MGNCCWKLPNPLRGAGAFESMERNTDWLVLENSRGAGAGITNSSSNSTSGGLTIILTLQENSKIETTTAWIESHAAVIQNVLISTPRRSSHSQPNWSSPAMCHLFQAIGNIGQLEVLLLHEVGTSSNPIPIRNLSQVVTKRHASLKQTYLVGHFVGDASECHTFADCLGKQPQLQSFALYGNATRDFVMDPILRAAADLPTLRYLYFHGNMPNPLQTDTIIKVGTMSKLETLTIHSCDTNGSSIATLAETLQASTCLKELTVFEAFELYPREALAQQPKSCSVALTRLLQHSPSLTKVQIWFGFASDSAVLIPFCGALAQNPRITHFEAALLWTDYDDPTAKAYVDLLACETNTSLQKLHLCNYTGRWRVTLYFYVRLNQTGRAQFLQDCEQTTISQWIDTLLTVIPPLVPQEGPAGEEDVPGSISPNIEYLDEAPEDDEWFALSWIYYYLRLQPSIMGVEASSDLAS